MATFKLYKFVKITTFKRSFRQEYYSYERNCEGECIGCETYNVPDGMEYSKENNKEGYLCGLYHSNAYCELVTLNGKPCVYNKRGRTVQLVRV